MNKRFLFFIAVFLVFVFVMQWKVPSQFVWDPTFSHGDSQPFGCLVFDSLMRRSVPAGYEVTRKTFAQLEREGYGRKPHAILVQAVGFQPTATDLRAMERLLKAGCKVFVATSYMDRDSLAVDLNVTVSGSSGFSPSWVRSSIENRSIPYDTLQWGCQPPYHEKAFPVYRAMTGNNVETDREIPCDTLVGSWAEDEEDDSLGGYWQARVVSIRHGKGELFVSCEPLLLTNYGILDRGTNGLVFRMMSQFRGLPVVRTEAYAPKMELGETATPLRFWLQHTPLRWTVYLTMLELLLFCVFFARRRQRVIPVVTAPENHSLEFVKQIGTLYHQKHVNRDLLQKKYGYFAETLRRELMIDVEDEAAEKENITQTALRTGMAEAEVRSVLKRVRSCLQGSGELTDTTLRKAIDGMDTIINSL